MGKEGRKKESETLPETDTDGGGGGGSRLLHWVELGLKTGSGGNFHNYFLSFGKMLGVRIVIVLKYANILLLNQTDIIPTATKNQPEINPMKKPGPGTQTPLWPKL